MKLKKLGTKWLASRGKVTAIGASPVEAMDILYQAVFK